MERFYGCLTATSSSALRPWGPLGVPASVSGIDLTQVPVFEVLLENLAYPILGGTRVSEHPE